MAVLLKKLLIAAGGTGGHIFPALAVADTAKEQGLQVEWCGTPHGLENRLDIPYPMHHITIKGLRNKGVLNWLLLPLRLLKAFWQSLQILRKVRPAAVLCFGGYVSFPIGFCAWVLGIPLFLQEQNAKAGLANRVLSRFAQKIFLAYPDSMVHAAQKQLLTGNPIRHIFIDTQKITHSIPHIVIIGGSQGALILNQTVPYALAQLKGEFTVTHQCGENHFEQTQKAYQEAGIKAKVVPFVQDMPGLLASADMMICRAGALTLTEITQVGVASILVPLPHAADNHQYWNARFLADCDAAFICPQEALSPTELAKKCQLLINNPDQRMKMAQHAKQCARPQAAKEIINECMKVV